jgi:hypothetical protein
MALSPPWEDRPPAMPHASSTCDLPRIQDNGNAWHIRSFVEADLTGLDAGTNGSARLRAPDHQRAHEDFSIGIRAT